VQKARWAKAAKGREVANGRYLLAGYAIKVCAMAWWRKARGKRASTIRMETCLKPRGGIVVLPPLSAVERERFTFQVARRPDMGSAALSRCVPNGVKAP
jgi:hypothetical protein